MNDRSNSITDNVFFRPYILVPVILCTLITGASGLMYEVTWHRYLANLFGSQARATALILSIFLGGLSVGYFIFGYLSRYLKPVRALLVYALVEALIGIWALIFRPLYHYIFSTVYQTGAAEAGLTLDITLCIVLIGIPTVGMGSTIPLLTRAFAGNITDTAKAHAVIYGSNTAGAFVGALLAGFVLIPYAGLNGSLIFAACGNGIGALLVLILSLLVSDKDDLKTKKTSEVQKRSTLHQLRWLMVSFLCGYAALSIQTVLIRKTGLAIGSSEYSFTMIVAAYILLLAVGAFMVAGPLSRVRKIWLHLLLVTGFCLLLYFSIPYWGYINHHVRIHISRLPSAQYVYYGVVFTLITLLLALPIGGLGATLPLLFQSDTAGFSESGKDAGYLYAANTAGCIAGALFGGYIFLYYVNLDQVFLSAAVSLVVASAITLPWVSFALKGRLLAAVSSLVVIYIITVISPWDRRATGVGFFRMQEKNSLTFLSHSEFIKRFFANQSILFSRDGPNTTVTVTQSRLNEDKDNQSLMPGRSLLVNGKSDGATYGGDRRTTKLLAYVPLLLSERPPSEVAVIGFGTGITAGTFAWFDLVSHVDVIEISPLVKEVSHYFSFYNMNAAGNKKLTFHIDDAYRFLRRAEKKYDVIVSEPSNPWVVGVERLYTREFLERAKNQLQPGGLYVQWIQLYSISEETVATALKTFSTVFPHTRMFANGMDLMVVGSDVELGQKNVAAAVERTHLVWIQKDLESIQIPHLEAFLSLEVPLPLEYYRDARVHTLEHPLISFLASRDFFSGTDFKLHNEITGEKDYLPWYATGVRRSLLTIYTRMLSGREEFIQSLEAFTSYQCQQRSIGLPSCWQDASHLCQSAWLTLIALGEIEPAEGIMPPSEVRILRHLFARFRGEEIVSVDNLSAAHAGVKMAEQIVTPYLILTPEDLWKLFATCYESDDDTAITCQQLLVTLFIQLGFQDAAYEAYQRFIVNAPPRSTHVQELIDEALVSLNGLPKDAAEVPPLPFFPATRSEMQEEKQSE